MGVCCIVFDIDGMLFEFFMNFLNIEKNKILRILVFNISCFLHVSCYLQHYKKNLVYKILGGGGCFFFRKRILSHFTFYAIFNIQNKIEKCPFTYWLNGRWFLQVIDIHVGNFNMKLTGRWFPQIVDRDSGNLYPIYIKQKLWCLFLNLLAGDLGRPSCLVTCTMIKR